MSTSGWRDEDEVSACNAFEMSLELCLKTDITDFPECRSDNTHRRKLGKKYFLNQKDLNPSTQR